MHLVSCEGCGVVLDQTKLKFAEDIYESDGSVDDTKASYSSEHRKFLPYVNCPVCKSEIFKES